MPVPGKGRGHGDAMDISEIFIRLGMATGAGILLGLDRELRGISAGIRTHALVAMSSALITVSALILYTELRNEPGTNLDPLRVIQGLAQAIGFVAAGAIFVSKTSVHNLTSAANIWLAAAIGIAAGAGQKEVVLIGVGFGVVIVTFVRVLEQFIPGSDKAGRD
jgi:putative Mg2+ transporter-C (MgtC) family protein